MLLVVSFIANISLIVLGIIFIVWEDLWCHAIDMETSMETYEVICDTTILVIILVKLFVVLVLDLDTYMSFGK